ncbi:MAG: response regulator [Okeania sp. SIO3C4]|nr:response regulator [Okeania sp. SIO3C4]
MLVENDPAIGSEFASYLKELGYIIEVAEDGDICLTLQEIFNPELIILDRNLPDNNSYDLSVSLKEKVPNLIIIMLAAPSDKLDKIRGFCAGVDDYLTKPFNLNKLKASIEALCKIKDPFDFKLNRIKKLNSLLGIDFSELINQQGEKLGILKDEVILCVEDDYENARIFSKVFMKRGGYCTLHTENVDEVLLLAESGIIDIILMDVSLARSVYQGKAFDGIQITQMLKSNPKTALIPVVLVTAHGMAGDRESFLLQSGADDYIRKPVVDYPEFLNVVRRVINSAKKINNYEEVINNFVNRLDYYSKTNDELRNDLKKAQNIIKDLETKLKEYKKNFLEKQIETPVKPKQKFNLWRGIKNQLQSSKSDELNLIKKQPSLVDTSEEKDISYQTHEISQIICADVVHSLKGEFLNIGGSNQEIRYLSNNSPEILEECELIQRSLEYSQIRLQKLMDYLNLGKQKMETIEIEKLIAEVEFLSRHRLPSNIDMEVKIQENIKGKTILGNSEQIKSILFELIGNSTKALYKPDSKIKIFVNYENDGLITLSIKDNGSGISDDLKNKLFKEVVESKNGSGIGLYLSNRIIHQMGGDLKLESSEKGTTITLFFNES